MADLEAVNRRIDQLFPEGTIDHGILRERYKLMFSAYHDSEPAGFKSASSSAANLLPRINLKIEGFVGDEKKLGEEVSKVIRAALQEPEFKIGQWVVFRDDYAPPSGRPQLLKLIHASDSFLSSYDRTFQKQLCRPATPEEMFKVGALVRHCRDKLKIEGLVRSYVQGVIRIIGAGGMTFYPDELTLIEPAPEKK